MVPLTRITGAQFALNPDLIERVDRTPDTIITLVDGAKYLVQESLEDVVAAAGKQAGATITISAFVRFQLGEGIEKKESDFAAEVAAASGVGKVEPVA